MKTRILIALVILVGVLLAAGILISKRSSTGDITSIFSTKPQGLSLLASRVPKNAGLFVAVDMRDQVDLKTELANLREKLKGNDSAIKAWDDVEKNLGLTSQELSQWVLPAGFFAVLPATGQTTLWGSPAKQTPAPDGAEALVACKSNLKNTATALEMYSTDNSGHYPKALAPLAPNYLKVMPLCPSANSDTYSNGYTVATVPDAYTLICQGHYHPQEDANFPQYTSFAGIVSKVNAEPTKSQTAAPVPYVVFGAPVADEKAAREQILKLLSKQGPVPPEVTIGAVKFWQMQESYLGVYDGFVLGGSSKEGVEALLASFTGKAENLTANPQFQGMRKKFPNVQGGIAYAPFAGLAEMLPVWAPHDTDEKTVEAIKGLQYAAASVTLKDGQMAANAFLALDPQSQSNFIKTWLTSPNLAMQSAQIFPAEWGNYSALNVHYVFNALLEAVRLSPTYRAQVDAGVAMVEKNANLSLENDVWAALNGEVAWSSDGLKKFPEMLKGNFASARGNGQLTSCKSNLKNIGTALEMYSTDNAGRYPKALAPLAPNYLKAIPICPAANQDTYSKSFQSAANPDAYTFMCEGKYHGAENFPQYTSYQGLIPGETHEAPPAASPDRPTYVFAVGIKDPAKADQLLAKIDGMAGQSAKAGAKVGDIQIYEVGGAYPFLRCTLSKPSPMLVIAAGPQAQAMLNDVIQVKNPIANLALYQSIWKNQPERWVHAGYLDITPLLKAAGPMVDNMPEMKTQAASLHALLDGIKDLSSASYAIVDADGVRLVSQGNGSVAVGGVATFAAILVPNFIRARSDGQLTACKSNEKNFGTALEMYATDNSGRYPKSMSALTPNYLRVIPVCPAAGSDTYSATYEMGVNPDAYTFFCKGQYHTAASLGENFPQYNSNQGLNLKTGK